MSWTEYLTVDTIKRVVAVVKKLLVVASGLWLLLAVVGFVWMLLTDLLVTGYVVWALFLAAIPVLYRRGRLDIGTFGALVGSFVLVESVVSLAVYPRTETMQHFLLMSFFAVITLLTWANPGMWTGSLDSVDTGMDDDWPIEDTDDGSAGRAIVYETVWGESPDDDDKL
jgi:hypothetical protein